MAMNGHNHFLSEVCRLIKRGFYSWDWFLSFDSILESKNEKYHTEIYFKTTQSHFYIVQLSFAEADRDAYPWKEIVETFTIS